MGIFDRTADDAAGTAALAVAFTKPERERIAALWRLTALPRDVFEATYGTMLAGFWRYVRAPQHGAWTTLKEQALTCAIAAGVAWLGQERAVMRAVAGYFGDGPSELRAIAAAAERRVGLPLDRGATALPAAAPPAPSAAASDGGAGRDPAPVPDPGTAAPGGGVDAAIGAGGGGWRWVNWVRAGLRDGTVAVNAAGGWLHNIGGEAYVVVPDGFAALALLEGLPAGTVKNRVSRIGRHRGRMSKLGPTGTFHAQLGDGRHAKGMLFPGALFWDDDPPPEADAELRKPWR